MKVALLLTLLLQLITPDMEESIYYVREPLWKVTYVPLGPDDERLFEGHKTTKVRELFVRWVRYDKTNDEWNYPFYTHGQKFPDEWQSCPSFEQIQWSPAIWVAKCEAVIDGSTRYDQIYVTTDNEYGPELWEEQDDS